MGYIGVITHFLTISWYIQVEINMEPKHGGLEADVPHVNGVIFRLQPFICRGVCRELTGNHTDLAP